MLCFYFQACQTYGKVFEVLRALYAYSRLLYVTPDLSRSRATIMDEMAKTICTVYLYVYQYIFNPWFSSLVGVRFNTAPRVNEPRPMF